MCSLTHALYLGKNDFHVYSWFYHEVCQSGGCICSPSIILIIVMTGHELTLNESTLNFRTMTLDDDGTMIILPLGSFYLLKSQPNVVYNSVTSVDWLLFSYKAV